MKENTFKYYSLSQLPLYETIPIIPQGAQYLLDGGAIRELPKKEEVFSKEHLGQAGQLQLDLSQEEKLFKN